MKLRPFELGLVIVFVALLFGALYLLGNFEGGGSDDSDSLEIGIVTIWGTLPAENFKVLKDEMFAVSESYRDLDYLYISPDEFSSQLVSAIAYDRAPDLVIISHEMLAEMRHHIEPILVGSDGFPLRDIRDVYLDGAQIFRLSDGLYAYPIALDPLMFYWNRLRLTAAGYFNPPTNWEELVNDYVPKLTVRNADRSIQSSAIAMGEYQNVRNAFGIISMLLLQGGAMGVVDNSAGSINRYSVGLTKSLSGEGNPLASAVDFYTRFSRSTDVVYSWNRSLPEDRTEFIGGKLAFYFGYASEGRQIEKINPNFAFDIAAVPQGKEATVKRTYGRFYGIAQLKTTDNKAGSAHVLGAIAQPERADTLARASDMVSVFNNTVKAGSNDLYGRVAYQVAPTTLGWLSPKQTSTREIFSTMVEDISGNRSTVSAAALESESKLARAYEIKY